MNFSSKLISTFIIVTGANLASATPLEDYNLILFDDFSPSGGSGHVHGTAFIGGDLNGMNPEFGARLPRTLTTDSVEVAGNLNANQVNMQSGYLAYQGSNNLGNINCNGNGLSGGACLRAAEGLDTKSADLYADLSADSAYYAELVSNGNIDLATRSLSYTGEATDLAVFNLNGSDLFAQNSNWSLDFGSAEKVVINILGDDLASAGGINLIGGFSHANSENILWNFYGADRIDIGATQWFGSILAINAMFDTDNDLNGTLVANSYVGNGQIHVGNWDWNPPENPPETSVPEPATYLLMLTGLGILGLRRIRCA